MAKKRVNHAPVETERDVMVLPVQLKADEIAAYADQAARAAAERDAEESARDAANKTAKSKIETLDGQVNSLLRKVRERAENRSVDVEKRWDFPQNAVRVVRLDTGEVVSERAMTFDERQTRLFELPAAKDAVTA
jgi:hypothetical protein